MNPLMSAMGPAGNMEQVMQLMNSLRGKNPDAIARMMVQQNPKFRQFAEYCKGKTPEQVAREYGIDLSQIAGMLK